MEDSRIDDIIAELRSLRLQVARLESELSDERNRPTPPTGPPARLASEDHGYAVGDRVYILNKIKKPATWVSSVAWSEAEAKKATITAVRTRQIFFTTDNGVETWRAPNNLRKLPDHE